MCRVMCFLSGRKDKAQRSPFQKLQDLCAKTMFSSPTKCPERHKKESLANPVSIDLRGQSGCKGYATMRLHNVGEHSCK